MLPQIKQQIIESYNTYITTVSRKDWAAALETSLYLYDYCEQNTPKTIVDLGSGFTSYIIKLYQQYNPSVQSTTVDDDERWLEKTKEFLLTYGVSTDNLVLWDDFKNTSDTFDLVFYDLGNNPTREANVESVCSLVGSNGAIIFDDAQSPNVRKEASRVFKKLNWTEQELRDTTTDEYGRFAMLVLNPS